jgi:hypothetical protein
MTGGRMLDMRGGKVPWGKVPWGKVPWGKVPWGKAQGTQPPNRSSHVSRVTVASERRREQRRERRRERRRS